MTAITVDDHINFLNSQGSQSYITAQFQSSRDMVECSQASVANLILLAKAELGMTLMCGYVSSETTTC